MPEIGIVGGGAVGLFLANALSRAGNIPILCIRREEQKKALQNGILVREGEAQFQSKVEPLLRSSSERSVELLFFCTKAYDLDEAYEAWIPILKKGGVVVFLQNGIGFWERFAEKAICASLFPYALSLTFGITKSSDSEVMLKGRGKTYLGALGSDATQREPLLDLLEKCELSPQYESNILSFLKKKAILNACVNPLTALLELQNGRLLHPVFSPLLKHCVAEAASGREEGKAFLDFVYEVVEKTKENRSSMLQDLLEGRQTEIAYLNGQFDTPIHTLLNLLVRAKSDATFSDKRLS